jgi:hypothetical protein
MSGHMGIVSCQLVLSGRLCWGVSDCARGMPLRPGITALPVTRPCHIRHCHVMPCHCRARSLPRLPHFLAVLCLICCPHSDYVMLSCSAGPAHTRESPMMPHRNCVLQVCNFNEQSWLICRQNQQRPETVDSMTTLTGCKLTEVVKCSCVPAQISVGDQHCLSDGAYL